MVNAGERRFKISVASLGAFPNGRPRSLYPICLSWGTGVWSAASAYQRRPGSTGSFRKGLQSCAAQPSRVGAYKPVAEGGIVALELSASGPNRGQPGAPGDRRQLHREKSSSSAVPPFVRPIASEYPLTLGSHGVPQWARGDDTDKCSCKEGAARQDHVDLALRRTQERLWGAGEGFFPAVSHT